MNEYIALAEWRRRRENDILRENPSGCYFGQKGMDVI